MTTHTIFLDRERLHEAALAVWRPSRYSPRELNAYAKVTAKKLLIESILDGAPVR